MAAGTIQTVFPAATFFLAASSASEAAPSRQRGDAVAEEIDLSLGKYNEGMLAGGQDVEAGLKGRPIGPLAVHGKDPQPRQNESPQSASAREDLVGRHIAEGRTNAAAQREHQGGIGQVGVIGSDQYAVTASEQRSQEIQADRYRSVARPEPGAGGIARTASSPAPRMGSTGAAGIDRAVRP